MIPVTDGHVDYAQSVVDACAAAGLRATVDTSGEKMGALIRRAKLAKIPYVLVVGDQRRRRRLGRGEPAWLGRKARAGRACCRPGGGGGRRGRAQGPARGPGAWSGRHAASASDRACAVSLEHLWAGWRREYIVEATARERAGGTSHDEAECVFCRLAASGPPSEDNLVVWRGDLTFVVMNAYPYASGHVLVLPLRHVGPLAELTEDGIRRAVVRDAGGGGCHRGGVRARRAQHGCQPRAGGRCGAAGSRPPPCPAALVG